MRVAGWRDRRRALTVRGCPFLCEFAAARVGTAGQSRVDVAQIAVTDDLGSAFQDGEQNPPRVVKAALVDVENRQIVGRLEGVRELAHELVEDADCLVPLSLMCPQDSVQDPAVNIAGFPLEIRIERPAGLAVALLSGQRECAVEGTLGESASG